MCFHLIIIIFKSVSYWLYSVYVTQYYSSTQYWYTGNGQSWFHFCLEWSQNGWHKKGKKKYILFIYYFINK